MNVSWVFITVIGSLSLCLGSIYQEAVLISDYKEE